MELRKNIQSMTAAMEKAAFKGDDVAIRDLLAKGSSVNCYDQSSHSSLLMWSCAWGLTNLCNFLIEHGADFKSHFSITGATALMDAAYYGRIDIVKLLLNKGVNPNQKNSSGCTAMDKCVLTENWKILKLLMNSGGNYKYLVSIDVDWEQVIPIDPETQELLHPIDSWLANWENYYLSNLNISDDKE
jgi:uncharacterized protein